MSEIAVCPKCGVPECISHKCAWLNNGDIVYRDSPEIRLVLAESERIDPLFNYMEQLIGGPIENIVFTAARRTARLYLSQFVSSETRRLVREKKMDASQVIEELLGIGSLMGCGIQRLLDMRYKGDNDDYVLIRVVKPFSLLLQIARMAGGVEALFGSEQGYSVQETAPDTWDMKIVPSPHLDEMKLQTHLCGYRRRPGAMNLERCSSCGGPAMLSGYSWNTAEGIVRDENTGRRMVMLGHEELDLLFDVLEKELGTIVPRLTVEALKRFTKDNPYTIFDWTTIEEFRATLAVRGVGYLKEMDVSRRGLSMKIENCVVPLMLIGIMQGVFEKAIKHDSLVAWHRSDEGDLAINIVSLAG